MDSKKEAVELVEDVILKMNNDEKDRLNVWNNLNDTDSEEKFFRAKIQVTTVLINSYCFSLYLQKP